MINFDSLKFDDKGLIPAVVQDFNTKKILTLAYMNRESLEISINERQTCFFSRSRQQLWRKGETSGNTQEIVSITADCDGDALVIEVVPSGPACHTGETSCFYQDIYEKDGTQRFSSNALYDLMLGRKTDKKEGSYTTYLFNEGEDKILKKVGEECTEVVIAAKNNDRVELVYEISDLYYHTMVLMVEKGIEIKEIERELASRHVVDKKEKQKYLK